MIESYIAARDRFLKPGGLMMPTMGSIVLAPFADATLYSDQVALNSLSPASRYLFSASMCVHTSSASQSRCMCAANIKTSYTLHHLRQSSLARRPSGTMLTSTVLTSPWPKSAR